MKCFHFLLLMAAFCLYSYPTLFAQNPGCDGIRYKNDLFTSVKKTTVPYAPAISYSGDSVMLQMDVYEPVGDNLSKRPVIVLAHGGSFMFGTKSDMAATCTLLAKKGYVVGSIQYRLFPFFLLGFPDSIAIFNTAMKAVGDMKAAVRYFRDASDTTNIFHADTANIFIGGYSAGAVTALHAGYLDINDNMPAFLAALLPPNGGLEGNSGSASNRSQSSKFRAIINLSGGLYRREWIDHGEVPMTSIHGTADATVPYIKGLAANIAYLEGTGLLHPHAQSVGVESLLTTVEGGGHTNIYDQPQYAAQLAAFWVQTTTLLERLICQTVSSEQPLNDISQQWGLYPNPVKGDAIRLELPPGLDYADVRLYSITGQLLMTISRIPSGSDLSLSVLGSGIYAVQILDPLRPEVSFGIHMVVKQ